MFALFKNTIFLIWLIIGLISISLTASIFALNATLTATKLTAQASATAIKHRKEITKAIAKVKAKARLRRMLTMVPIAGIAAGGYFEEQDYQEWLIDNPDGKRSEYLCELSNVTAEVLDEWVDELPEKIKPSPNTIGGWMPECDQS